MFLYAASCAQVGLPVTPTGMLSAEPRTPATYETNVATGCKRFHRASTLLPLSRGRSRDISINFWETSNHRRHRTRRFIDAHGLNGKSRCLRNRIFSCYVSVPNCNAHIMFVELMMRQSMFFGLGLGCRGHTTVGSASSSLICAQRSSCHTS